MSEINNNPENLPSGYLSSEQLDAHPVIDSQTLPWLKEPMELSIAKVTVEGGDSYLMASAVSSHKRLVEAAQGLTDHQRQITDNMFYSRLPSFIKNNFANNVETLVKMNAPFPVHVMRNKGGQRVYFGMPLITLEEGQEPEPVILRLAVSDKNKQGEVMKVLSAGSESEKRMHKSK